jgi:hypothetical protein
MNPRRLLKRYVYTKTPLIWLMLRDILSISK